MARRTQSLRCIRLFRELSDEEIHSLDAQCLWRRYEAKEQVICQEDRDTDVFFVVAGLMRSLIRADCDRHVILNDVGVGEFFGELAAIDSQPRSATVVAITSATLARMSARLFRATVRQHADVCAQLLAVLVTRVRSLDIRVGELAMFDMKHRLFAELLRLS